MKGIEPKEIIEEISNLKTGEKYNNDQEWKAKGIPPEDIRRDVRVIMPSLDLFGETKQNGTMAITRAQQVKQMLKQGGRTGFFTAGLARGENISPGTSTTGGMRDDNETTRGAPPGRDVVTKPPVKNKYGDDTQERFDKYREKFINEPIEFPKYTPSYLRILEGPLTKGQKFTRTFNIDKVAKSGRYQYTDPVTGKTYTFDQDLALENPEIFEAANKQLLQDRLSGKVDAFGNPLNQGDDGPDNQILFPQQGIMTQAPSNMDQGTETEEDPFKLALAFRKDGGRIGAMDGGIMDTDIIGGAADGNIDEMGRQMYFVGKLVKKATRAVKKIVKSPIGKAALIGGGLGLAGIGPFAGLRQTAFGKGLAGIFGEGSFNPLKRIVGVDKDVASSVFGKIFDKVSPFQAITAASVVAGALTAEQEEEAQLLADNTGIDIEAARNSILQAAKENYAMDSRARGFKADGGIMRLGYQEGSKEPVAKKTMPLLDMGGKEMDLREDGGFVPIGRMEKADDVPARLSKNEFVFTADAVRNAGDGNVDKGAEVMYNMMKNLESGGDVSEESQGLEGARRMFQTSQRLEEVL